MSFNYDVIIVGAGPIGSTLAYKLALNNNIKVCLIDRKEKIVKVRFKRKVGEEYKNIDFKVDKETKLHIDFNPLGEKDSKVYTADFVNDGWIGIFNGFERVN